MYICFQQPGSTQANCMPKKSAITFYHLFQRLSSPPAESKTRTYHGRVGAGRCMAGPEWTSTVRFAQETSVPRAHQGTEDNCPESFFGSKNCLIRI